jgi:hypothetical protein
MPTGNIYRPGEIVPVSGIYNVVDVFGTYAGRQSTEERGHRFPPVRHGTTEWGYRLHQKTVHLGR